VTTFWYGLGTPARQAEAALDLVSAQPATAALISGDVAADLLAPWARPQRAVVYARTGADLAAAGLTPSPAEQATLAFIVPADPGVWIRPGESKNGVPLADPLQVLWDLQNSPGPDADQAAGHFRSWLLNNLDAEPESREAPE
jgi:hypothetical protein